MPEWLSRKPMLHYLLWRMGLARALTQTTPAEQAALAKYATGRKKLVEIGVWHGVNTREFRRVMASDGILFAVDPFYPSRFGLSWLKLIAQSEVSQVRNGTVKFVETTSEQAVRELSDQDYDFVFIDGDHSWDGVRLDWELWAPKIAPHGIIALHDSRSHPGRNIDHTSVVKFTRQFVHTDPRFEILDEIDSLTVLRRC